eukprot:scaffold7782_cov113-Isochrysis_galbana.AAC.5
MEPHAAQPPLRPTVAWREWFAMSSPTIARNTPLMVESPAKSTERHRNAAQSRRWLNGRP